MSAAFETAAETLYGVSLKAFVAERKRLSAELKAADKAEGAAFLKLGRPGQSAWAVNQLYRVARPEWDALVEITGRLRGGSLAGAAEQRTAVQGLRARAAELLQAEGGAAGDAVLTRVETNLRALAATGWGEVPAGRLVDDREEPGFDVLQGFAALAVSQPRAPEPQPPSTARQDPASAEPTVRRLTLVADPEPRPDPAPTRDVEAEERARARAAELARLEQQVAERAGAEALARERLDAAAARVAALEAELAEARAAADERTRAHQGAHQRLAEARAALAAQRAP